MSDSISYELIRSSRKTVSIQISPEGKIIVRAPQRLAKYRIDDFVLQNAEWIDKSLAKVRQRNAEREDVEYLTPEQISELKKMAKQQLLPMVENLAQLVGVTYNRVSIRAQRSRWGSCSREGNLNFNCLLMMTPVSVRRYVIVHELCHRREMNHSDRFWAEVENVIPDYKQQRKWLRSEGSKLIQRLPE